VNREEELRAAFKRIASVADILVGNEEDFQLALGIEGPDAGGKDIGAKVSAFESMIAVASKEYPGASLFATTLREVNSANSHNWGALLVSGGKTFFEPLREIPVYDRIGGGDAFVSGVLYGVLRGWDPEKCLQFGWATGALAVSVSTDFVMPADEEQIWSIYKGNARIKR